MRHYSFFSLIVVTLLLSGFAGCETKKDQISGVQEQSFVSPSADSTYFQEIGAQIGLNFSHSIGGTEMKNIVESVGGGAAFLDYDNDG